MTPPVYGSGHQPTNLPIKHLPEVLDVVAVVSNPARFRSRYHLYRNFARYVEASGARLTTVECAHGERPFEVTSAGNPAHVQVRTSTEVWLKECLLNIGISRLPSDWKYVAWVDADVTFARPDWVQETLQQLQHHPVVQMWSVGLDLGPNFEPFQQYQSFAAGYRRGFAADPAPAGGSGYGGQYYHSGYSWAATRQAIDTMGGLLDFAPLGSADFYMAWGLVGQLGARLYQSLDAQGRRKPGFSPNYINRLMQWQDRASALRGDVGVVPGAILHSYHGPKAARQYNSRENILIDCQFDPDLDLRRDSQNLWQLTDAKPALRDQIRAYFATRDEDR